MSLSTSSAPALEGDSSILTGLPAFILGNGPLLPVDELGVLRDKFTIGVNRILRCGFEPTVLLWVDHSVYKDDGEQIDAYRGLKVCDQSIRQRQGHIGLKMWKGDSALANDSKPDVLCCNGNTGTCAARWAVSLGCEPVYLVGMSATYVPGEDQPKTDFYGFNKRHHNKPKDDGTLMVMRWELHRVLRDFPGRVREMPDGTLLREVAATLEPVDQSEARQAIKALLSSRGVEVMI